MLTLKFKIVYVIMLSICIWFSVFRWENGAVSHNSLQYSVTLNTFTFLESLLLFQFPSLKSGTHHAPHPYSRIIMSLKNSVAWTETLLLSELKLNSPLFPPCPFNIKHHFLLWFPPGSYICRACWWPPWPS